MNLTLTRRLGMGFALMALLPLLANGKTSHAMHDTFRELHQQIRCNADEQAAQAVLELAQ